MKVPSLLLLGFVIARTLTTTALVDGKAFTVSIVGQQQSNAQQHRKDGLPAVYCPKIASTRPNGHFDEPSGACFFVLVQNAQKVANKVTMAASEWYDCLQFKMTDGSGRIYSISRAPMDWSANVQETWTFPSEGMRVTAVDFTSSAMVGQTVGWQGLPPAQSEPEIVHMTATFRYYYSTGKPVSVTSEPTDVYLRFK
jgi:hypothetical protein